MKNNTAPADMGSVREIPPAISEALDDYGLAHRNYASGPYPGLSNTAVVKARKALESAILSALPREEPQPAPTGWDIPQARQAADVLRERQLEATIASVRTLLEPVDTARAARTVLMDAIARSRLLLDHTLESIVPPEPAPSGEALEAAIRERAVTHFGSLESWVPLRDVITLIRAQFGSPPSPTSKEG